MKRLSTVSLVYSPKEKHKTPVFYSPIELVLLFGVGYVVVKALGAYRDKVAQDSVANTLSKIQ